MRRINHTPIAKRKKFHHMVDEIRAFRPEADYRFSLANSAGLYLSKTVYLQMLVLVLFNTVSCHPLMCQIDWA